MCAFSIFHAVKCFTLCGAYAYSCVDCFPCNTSNDGKYYGMSTSALSFKPVFLTNECNCTGNIAIRLLQHHLLRSHPCVAASYLSSLRWMHVIFSDILLRAFVEVMFVTIFTKNPHRQDSGGIKV